MEKKLVSFRIEKSTFSESQNQLRHDFRQHIPSYVDLERTKNNVELFISENFKEAINLQSSQKKSQLQIINERQKERIKQLTKRTAQNNAEYFNQGIITFSPSMRAVYETNTELFNQCALNFIAQINKKYGLNALYAVTHNDEETPHIHLLFDNISEKSGKSIRRKINPKVLSDIQSLLGECYSPLGFKRGEYVTDTRREHLGVREYKETAKSLNDLAARLGITTSNAEMENFFSHLADKSAEAHAVAQVAKNKSEDLLSAKAQKQIKQSLTTLLKTKSPKPK